MVKTYSISTKSKIILYGAATIGVLTYRNLTKRGYEVEAFIDQRADEIKSLYDRPVYKPDSDCLYRGLEKDTIIIITVKNVFAHESIYQFLSKLGYTKIIYKPYNCLIGEGTPETLAISDVYDSIITDHFSIEIKDIPIAKKNTFFQEKDFAIIEEKNESFVAYVPIELVFTNYGDKENDWVDIPICALYPHIQFFTYLAGNQNSNIDDYVKYCIDSAKKVGNVNITESWKRNVISNRINVFEQMRTALDIDPKFFVRNAPKAKWNENGYYNLLSGKHRSTFLISQGFSYIPLIITKEDYGKWLHKDKLGEVIHYIELNHIYEIDSMITHPMFYRFPIKEGKYLMKFQIQLMQFVAKYLVSKFGKVDFSKLSILDTIESTQCFYRVFKRCGSNVIKEVTKKEKNDINERINELLYVNFPEKEESEEEFDFILCTIDKETDYIVLLKKFDSIKCKYLIVITNMRLQRKDIECVFETYSIESRKYMYIILIEDERRK